MLKKINMNSEIAKNITQTKTELEYYNHEKYIIANSVMKDMMFYTQI
jgi:hypothetical protein